MQVNEPRNGSFSYRSFEKRLIVNLLFYINTKLNTDYDFAAINSSIKFHLHYSRSCLLFNNSLGVKYRVQFHCVVLIKRGNYQKNIHLKINTSLIFKFFYKCDNQIMIDKC